MDSILSLMWDKIGLYSPQMTDLHESSVGEAIRAARQRKGKAYTFRRIEELSAELAEQDDQRYEKLTRTVLWSMETGGADYILKRRISPGKIRALIQILFDGNTAKFVQDTGIVITDIDTQVGEPARADVPLYLERERPDQARRFVRPAVAVDFVLEVRTSRMEPVLAPGALTYCLKLQSARAGEVAILNLPEEGLILATALTGNRFRYERTQRTFPLPEGGSVYGVVEWTKPMLSV